MLTTAVATVHDNAAHGDDAYLVRSLGEDIFLDAVIDGVTRRKGREASLCLAAALGATPLRSVEDVVAVLEEVNQRLYQLGCGRFWLTTVATALYLDNTLYVVSVGDSLILLVRPESSQSLCSGLRGVYVGAHQQLIHVYRAQVTLQPGDRVLLATDGVTDGVKAYELSMIMRQAPSPEDAAAAIHTAVRARQAAMAGAGATVSRIRGDDCTAIVRFFDVAPVPLA